MTVDELCQRMAALGNTTRMEIYRVLVRAGRPGLSVSKVQERVGVPASTLSHHLRRLVDVGLARQERAGTTLVCSADYAVMESTFALFAAECCADETEICQSQARSKSSC